MDSKIFLIVKSQTQGLAFYRLGTPQSKFFNNIFEEKLRKVKNTFCYYSICYMIQI